RWIGGSPLDLRLIAEAIRLERLEEKKTEPEQLNWLASNTPRGSLVRGHLFQRILDHIHSENARKLAHPGLVIRRLTPEVILHVLNGPCKLGIRTIGEAAELFKELSRETFLADSSDDQSYLRIRPDLRPTVLRLIEDSKAEKVAEIENAAIGYYESRQEKEQP